jgi:ABC-type multidrug transport system fused ATPase/permease subunit
VAPDPTTAPAAPPPAPSDRTDAPGLRSTARSLLELHGSATRPLLTLGTVSIVAGIAEAGALLLFIRAATSIAIDDPSDFTVAGIPISNEPGRLLVIAGGLIVVATLLHTVLARGSARLSLQVLTNARTRLIDGFMNAQWPYQAAAREGTLQEATLSLAGRAATTASYLVVACSTLTILVALIVMAVIIEPTVTLLMLVALVPVLLILQPITRATRRRAHQTVKRSFSLAEEVASTTTLAREFRTFGVRRPRGEHLKQLAAQASASQFEARSTNTLASFLFKDLALLAFIVIIGVLYLFVDLRASATTAAVLIIIRALGYAQLTYNVAQHGVEDSGAVQQLVARIDEAEAAADPVRTTHMANIGTIEFHDVGFAYSADRPALHRVDLSIRAGEAIGLIGPSGAGKTTIAELILGLRAPSRGRVTVDGVDLADIDDDDWTRICALVPQDPRLIEGTIAENIRFFRARITEDEIHRAAELAHLADAIHALPDGFETKLGARSQGLSGGQRQRLAIARALAGNPQVLVLDEPTSALDSASEELFRQTLHELRGRVTLVVIAHRPTTIDVCDTVITVDDGAITSTTSRRESA